MRVRIQPAGDGGLGRGPLLLHRVRQKQAPTSQRWEQEEQDRSEREAKDEHFQHPGHNHPSPLSRLQLHSSLLLSELQQILAVKLRLLQHDRWPRVLDPIPGGLCHRANLWPDDIPLRREVLRAFLPAEHGLYHGSPRRLPADKLEFDSKEGQSLVQSDARSAIQSIDWALFGAHRRPRHDDDSAGARSQQIRHR